MSQVSQRVARAVLYRLLVVCQVEERALGRAASRLRGERRNRLRQQASRRLTFQTDLRTSIVALGGRLETGRSLTDRLRAAARGVRERLTATREQNPYSDCARATERTESAYAKALRMTLPSDVHSDVERQHAEVELDRKELQWLRHGGSLGRTPGSGASVPRAVLSTTPHKAWVT
jgi:uncharacterized protein (TIGR02284 family)